MYICYNLTIILRGCVQIEIYILLFKQNHMMILELHEMLVIYAFSFANPCYQFTMCFVIVVFLLLIFSIKYVAYLDSFEDRLISLIINNYHTMFTNVHFGLKNCIFISSCYLLLMFDNNITKLTQILTLQLLYYIKRNKKRCNGQNSNLILRLYIMYKNKFSLRPNYIRKLLFLV